MEKQTPWRVEKISILETNFVFFLRRGNDCLLVDPGDAKPVVSYLKTHQLNLKGILITHHHWDHTDGIAGVLEHYPCPVYGPAHENIPALTNKLKDDDSFSILDLKIEILELPGHTLGHIAYWIPEEKWLFSGDVLFALGCGRLFEGTFAQMFHSLGRLKKLPDQSLVFCTHDYFADNLQFCQQQSFDIGDYESIHPLLLAEEKLHNPFMNAPTLEIFEERREKRNNFKRV